jgi:hypothetical protein
LPIIMVVIAAALTSGGMGEVAPPTVAHVHWGAGGYGVLLRPATQGKHPGPAGHVRSD